MVKEKMLVIGASRQLGMELTLALRKIYGNANVVASDLSKTRYWKEQGLTLVWM